MKLRNGKRTRSMSAEDVLCEDLKGLAVKETGREEGAGWGTLLDRALEVPYVNADHRRVAKNDASMNSLIDCTITQSQCIKIGNALEKIVNYWVASDPTLPWKLMSNPVEKHEKQKDVLLKNEETQEILYAEIKANLELDTEKAPKTIQKIESVHTALQDKYPGWKVHSFLLSGRYLAFADIPAELSKRYQPLWDRGFSLLGMNEFLAKVGMGHRFVGYEEYRTFWTRVAKHMFFRK